MAIIDGLRTKRSSIHDFKKKIEKLTGRVFRWKNPDVRKNKKLNQVLCAYSADFAT